MVIELPLRGDSFGEAYRSARLGLMAVAPTGFDLFPDRTVVAMRVDGVIKDLATTVTGAEQLEPVEIGSPDGLAILRHSAAHVTAQALQAINPQARLGIGPPIQTATTTTSSSRRRSRRTTSARS